jgi:uncharacterized membrane protein
VQQDPATRVSAPAVGLIVTGALGLIISLVLLAFTAFGSMVALLGEDAANDLPGFGMSAIWMLVNLVVTAFMIYAGLQMRKLQGWGLSIAASVLAMIPCINPCCLLGLPIGIWAILVLIDADVKRAFDAGNTGPYDAPPGSYGTPPPPSRPPGPPPPPPPPGDVPRPPTA